MSATGCYACRISGVCIDWRHVLDYVTKESVAVTFDRPEAYQRLADLMAEYCKVSPAVRGMEVADGPTPQAEGLAEQLRALTEADDE